METPWKDDLDVLEFLKRKYPLYHLSNVFFRDIQFGLQAMIEEGGRKVGYAEAERFARELVSRLERKEILRPVDHQTWVLQYEPYRKPSVKPVPAEKPVPKPAAPARA